MPPAMVKAAGSRARRAFSASVAFYLGEKNQSTKLVTFVRRRNSRGNFCALVFRHRTDVPGPAPRGAPYPIKPVQSSTQGPCPPTARPEQPEGGLRPQEDTCLPRGRSQTSPLTPLLLRSTGLRPSGAGSGSPRPPRTTPGIENSSNPTDTGHGAACTGVFNARAFGEPPAPGRAPGRGSNTSTNGGTGSATSPQWSHTGSPDPIETPTVPHRDPRPPNGPTQGPRTWLPDPTGTPYRDPRHPRDPRWHNTGTQDPTQRIQAPQRPHQDPKPHRDPTQDTRPPREPG